MKPEDFEPTHVVVKESSVDTGEGVDIDNAVIESVLGMGTEVVVRGKFESLENDHPDVSEKFETSFEYTRNDEVELPEFRSSIDDESREAILSLLRLKTWHRFVCVNQMMILDENETILYYVPDHNVLELELGPEKIERIKENEKRYGFRVVPSGKLVEWVHDGKKYTLDPPSFCVNKDPKAPLSKAKCFSISNLEGFEVDSKNLRLRLSWGKDPGLMGKVLDFIAPTEPSELEFEDERTFREVVDAFDKVV